MSSSPNKPVLKLDWCSHEAARWAVEHWHYSKSMPTPPVVKIGVWEDERFIGVVLFSRGANANLGKPYSISVTEVCELTRVALSKHGSPVSKVLSVALKMLKAKAPGLRLVVSYADPNHDHNGAVYQAGNWIYTGASNADFQAIDQTGRVWHSRQVSRSGVARQYGELRRVPKLGECAIVPLLGKYRYLYPLDAAMRAQIAPLAKPYPKRAVVVQAVEQPRPSADGVAERPDRSRIADNGRQ